MSNERKRKVPAPGERLEHRKGRPWHGNNIVLTLHFVRCSLSPRWCRAGQVLSYGSAKDTDGIINVTVVKK